MRSMLISAISATRFFSMLMRDSTIRCRSLAAAYSAFSRRSPSSRARLISLGSSSFNSRSRACISSSNFLIKRSFIVPALPLAAKISWYHSAMLARVRRITSRQNALVAEFRAIARGGQPGLLLDGPHLVAEALSARVAVRAAMITADARNRGDVGALVGRVERSGGQVLSVSAPVMAAVSPVRSSSVIVAIADRPPRSGERLYAGTPLVVVACDVQDPGNVGAIVRVAEAAGGSGLIAAGRCADPFGPKALRGSMGSALRLPIAVADVETSVADARRNGCRVLAGVPRGGRSIFDI